MGAEGRLGGAVTGRAKGPVAVAQENRARSVLAGGREEVVFIEGDDIEEAVAVEVAHGDSSRNVAGVAAFLEGLEGAVSIAQQDRELILPDRWKDVAVGHDKIEKLPLLGLEGRRGRHDVKGDAQRVRRRPVEVVAEDWRGGVGTRDPVGTGDLREAG